MSSYNRKIVVVVPVKNEDWILDRFLTITSIFADLIIIADQGSMDNSREIYKKFSKAVVVDNTSPTYDEGYRQRLLLTHARALVPGPRFILALDADEVLAWDSVGVGAWGELRKAASGNVFLFEKAEILSPVTRCRRNREYFPLGYADDGIDLTGGLIHSIRVPVPLGAKMVRVEEIKFAHLALVRPLEYRARQRWYSVIENVNGTKGLWHRLLYYSPEIYWKRLDAAASETPKGWLEEWRRGGVHFDDFLTSNNNRYNWQVLEMMRKYGAERFAYDDIWDLDWEDVVQPRAMQSGAADKVITRVKRPSLWQELIRRSMIRLIQLKLGAYGLGKRSSIGSG